MPSGVPGYGPVTTSAEFLVAAIMMNGSTFKNKFDERNATVTCNMAISRPPRVEYNTHIGLRSGNPETHRTLALNFKVGQTLFLPRTKTKVTNVVQAW